jgi:DNA-binding MarR family transcriptional regulator
MEPVKESEMEGMVLRLREHMRSIFGITDSTGFELFGLIHRLANLSEAIECQQCGGDELSGPRWRLLLRLFAEETLGNKEGLTPTSLSHYQRVSKNTISSLLRGLEQQGLLQRTLDPQDYRLFRIQLTQAGRDLVRESAPQRIRFMNQMAASLEPEEFRTLMASLDKLHHSLMATAHPNKDPKFHPPFAENLPKV